MKRLILASLTFLFVLAGAATLQAQRGCDDNPGDPLTAEICAWQDGMFVGGTYHYTPGPSHGWCGSIENDQYIGFTAATSTVVFRFSVDVLTGPDGLQAAIYDLDNNRRGNCFSQVSPGGSAELVAVSLTPGQVYLIRVDGYAGTLGEFTMERLSGFIDYVPYYPCRLAPLPPIGTQTRIPIQIERDEVVSYYTWALSGNVNAFLTEPVFTFSPFNEIELLEAYGGLAPGEADTLTITVQSHNLGFGSSAPSSQHIVVQGPGLETLRREVCSPQTEVTVFGQPFPVTGDVARYPHPLGPDSLGRERFLDLYTATLPVPVAIGAFQQTGALTVACSTLPDSTSTLQWDFGDGTTSDVPTVEHTYDAPGTYLIALTITNACGSNSTTASFNVQSSSLAGLPSGARLQLYPNPTSSECLLDISGLPGGSVEIMVTDVLGRSVDTRSVAHGGAFRQNLNLGDLPPGRYQVAVKGEGYFFARELVKR